MNKLKLPTIFCSLLILYSVVSMGQYQSVFTDKIEIENASELKLEIPKTFREMSNNLIRRDKFFKIKTKERYGFRNKKGIKIFVYSAKVNMESRYDGIAIWTLVNEYVDTENTLFRESGFYMLNGKPVYFMKLTSLDEKKPVHRLIFFAELNEKFMYGSLHNSTSDYTEWNKESISLLKSLRLQRKTVRTQKTWAFLNN